MKIIYLVLVFNFLYSSNGPVLNGDIWKTWTFVGKVGYVDGFLDGFNTYENLLDNIVLLEKKRDPYWLPPLFITILKNYSIDYLQSVNDFDSVELAKRIDAFYYDPDNFGIKINDAIKILNLREIGKGKVADDFLLECQKKYLKDK